MDTTERAGWVGAAIGGLAVGLALVVPAHLAADDTLPTSRPARTCYEDEAAVWTGDAHECIPVDDMAVIVNPDRCTPVHNGQRCAVVTLGQ